MNGFPGYVLETEYPPEEMRLRRTGDYIGKTITVAVWISINSMHVIFMDKEYERTMRLMIPASIGKIT